MATMNFSWILPGSLAGARGPMDPDDVVFLKQQGIQTVIRMEQKTISAEPWQMKDVYEYVQDFMAPTMEQVHHIVTFMEEEIKTLERPVVVTCMAGLGRTGTVLACYLLREGYGPEEAIGRVRQLRPGSIETQAQAETVRKYAEYLRE